MNAYIVTGRRSNNEIVYLVESTHQARGIIPNALSMAKWFTKRADAVAAQAEIAAKFKGVQFKVERINNTHMMQLLGECFPKP